MLLSGPTVIPLGKGARQFFSRSPSDSANFVTDVAISNPCKAYFSDMCTWQIIKQAKSFIFVDSFPFLLDFELKGSTRGKKCWCIKPHRFNPWFFCSPLWFLIWNVISWHFHAVVVNESKCQFRRMSRYFSYKSKKGMRPHFLIFALGLRGFPHLRVWDVFLTMRIMQMYKRHAPSCKVIGAVLSRLYNNKF